ncbi:MAG TPA: hypothetical protein VM165_06380, partial [Planctomycetaceae bacterium]|nr:hypothetical protein [Planctomycetaceae bacterium]
KRVFPFFPMYTGYNPTDGGGSITYGPASPRPASWVGHQGVWSPPHPGAVSPSDPLNNEYQYDADNDGDGIREGIWLDLDYPVQELSDGTTFLPIFSITVLDQNGLFDLNAHGNIQELLFTYPSTPFATSAAQPFGWNTAKVPPRQEFISASNLGMHAGEVNPAWGLTGRPGLEVTSGNIGTVFSQYQLFFGSLPNDSSTIMPTTDQQKRPSWQEVANMELAFLKMGRPEINSGSGSLDDLFPGVYGEEHLIAQNLGSAGSRDPRLYPHPGTSVIDDNNDLNEGMQTAPRQTAGADPIWLDVEHPFDALGIGTILGTNGTNPKSINRTQPVAASARLKWPVYTNYASNGNVFWGQATISGGNLMSSSQAYGLFDDPSELALYANDQRDVDDPLAAGDAAFLAMSNTDITNLGVTSRLQDLAKFNFSTDASGTNQRGEAIRKRFTTNANDRKSYAVPRQAGNTGRFWEWTDDNGRDQSQISSAQQNNVKLRFPPTFGNSGSAIQRYSTTDPFRPALRYLLQATRDDLQVTKQYQQRLSVNQLLTYNNQSKKLEYRELTLHPLDPGAGQIPATTVYPPTNALQQEFWARKDRQQMARDLYVMLYLLGPGPNGSSTSNPTRTSWMTPAPNYTDRQLEQMARFAVNVVDAQDRDNVITRFEYDKDLSNGWNLDDNPYSTDASTDRAEVWGVERQELSWSEAIAVETSQTGMGMGVNKPETSWDDTTDRQFVCLELRNHAPYNIKFTDNEAWQIVIRQREPQDMAYNPLLERRIVLRNNAGRVDAGNFFTIYTTDMNEPSSATCPSVMQVDPDGMGMGLPITPIVPNVPAADSFVTMSATSTSNHLDLVEDAVSGGDGFIVRDGNDLDLTGTAGSVLSDGPPGMESFVLDKAEPAHFILRRRAHPTRTKPTSGSAAEDADNPWVEVDRIAVDMKEFRTNPGMGMGMGTIAAQLAQMTSTERAEPLDRATEAANTSGGSAKNTLGNNLTTLGSAENSGSSTPLTYWQAHFDRDFTSPGDLLLVPVVGPPPNVLPAGTSRTDGLTTYFGATWAAPKQQYGSSAGSQLPATPYFQDYAKNALGMFAVPQHPLLPTTPPPRMPIEPTDNRWHRVLEFLEVPTRQNRNLGLGSEFDIARVPGKINLNTIRHAEVLAGLIDDETVADLNLVHPNTGTSITDSNYPKLQDKYEMLVRDWFEQLQASRDQTDPYWSNQMPAQLLALPGLPINAATGTSDYGRPFRPLSFNQDGNRSVEHTLLRSLPIDIAGSATSNRHLFEVATSAEHTPASGTPLDPLLRNRILSKMWNNTTTRSNSFVVFISAKLFRAHVDTATGAVQVGGPLREYSVSDVSPELPEYRGVFVVDRSDLEAAGQSGGGGLTSFRPFVKYRKILQE